MELEAVTLDAAEKRLLSLLSDDLVLRYGQELARLRAHVMQFSPEIVDYVASNLDVPLTALISFGETLVAFEGVEGFALGRIDTQPELWTNIRPETVLNLTLALKFSFRVLVSVWTKAAASTVRVGESVQHESWPAGAPVTQTRVVERDVEMQASTTAGDGEYVGLELCSVELLHRMASFSDLLYGSAKTGERASEGARIG